MSDFDVALTYGAIDEGEAKRLLRAMLDVLCGDGPCRLVQAGGPVFAIPGIEGAWPQAECSRCEAEFSS